MENIKKVIASYNYILIDMTATIKTLYDLGKLIEKGYYETLDLLYCICLYELNEKELAKEAFSSIYTESFHFVFRKSFTIRYLNLKKKLFNKLTKEEENTLAELYSKTGYLYLNI